MNLAGLSILDCDHAGLLLKNVSASRVSDCLVRNERDQPSAAARTGDWVPLVFIDSPGNMIEESLLGEPRKAEP